MSEQTGCRKSGRCQLVLRARALFLLLSSSAVLAGCDHTPRPDPVTIDRVEIAAAKLTLGFARGTLRSDVQTDAFAISRHPTTRAEYETCVEGGVCQEVSCLARAPAFVTAGELPVDCVSPDDARRFCTWVGGSLPSLPQWFLAARGSAPRRFAWGDTSPTCAQHPLAGIALSSLSGVSDARFGRGVQRCGVPVAALTVGQHADVRAEGGMEDVLLTPTELVRGFAASPFGACRDENAGGCVVYGLEAGAIDGLSEVEARGASGYGVGFRCVWEN